MDAPTPSPPPATPSPGGIPPAATESAPTAPKKRRQGNKVVRAGEPSGKSGSAAVTIPAPSSAPATKRQRRPTVKALEVGAAKKKAAAPRPTPTPPPAAPTAPSPSPVTPTPPPPPPTATESDADEDDCEVTDTMPESTQIDPDDMADFITQLDESHTLGLDDIAMSMADESQGERGSPEVEELDAQTMKKKQTRSVNYKTEEDVALCDAWMNVSLDATVGADQTKDTFWRRIEEYYASHVSIPSNRTQGSLTHRWSVIQDQCNRWSGCVDQVNIAPPIGVPLNEYEPIIQELYKQRNKIGGGKGFSLHHCYKVLQSNEKWARRNYETTPRRTRLSISIDADDDVQENPSTPISRPDGQKVAKEKKKNGGVGAYKEELVAMIEVKRVLAAERKEEKMSRWRELKMMEEERWRAKAATEDRKVQAEERRLAIEEQRLAMEAEEQMNKRKMEECAIMFMDASTMDETARQYWKITRGEILARSRFFSGGPSASGGASGGGDHGSA